MKKVLILLLLLPACAYGYLHRCCALTQIPGWWGSGDYMLVWRKQRYYPPLITTNSMGNVPDLGVAGTSILFGDEEVGDSPLSGGRGDFGVWVTRCIGGGGTFFTLGREAVDYDIGVTNGTGEPIIGRPYTIPTSGTETALLIAFPTLNPNGFVSVNTTNSIWGGDLYVRYRMLQSRCVKFDLLGGYRFTRIDDDLDVESVTTTTLLETSDITDHFGTRNDFYSFLLGFLFEIRSQCWAAQAIGKVGLGNMVKHATIYGQTTTTFAGISTVTNGGLLAQPSNSGNHSLNQYEVVPEINAQVQLRIWPHFWVTLGYQYIFWPRILLAGNQVNLDIDLTQLTPNPQFVPHDTSFWAQGLTAGFYFLF